jgi:hypothetical protein
VSKPAKLIVNDRQKFGGGLFVSRADPLDKPRHFTHGSAPGRATFFREAWDSGRPFVAFYFGPQQLSLAAPRPSKKWDRRRDAARIAGSALMRLGASPLFQHAARGPGYRSRIRRRAEIAPFQLRMQNAGKPPS